MAQSQPIYDAQSEQELMAFLWSKEIKDDPRAFVRAAYPWGKAGTPLEELKGPRKWQDDTFKSIADYIKESGQHKQIFQTIPEMFRDAVVSGRGPGKSAEEGMLAHWMVSTRIGSSVWVTANGEPQLKTKTFPEISKWVSMSINAHWFDINATSIMPAKWLAELVSRDLKIDPKYWYIVAQLWSEENPDAFAGAHNTNGEMYIFDEASGIPKPIWTVAQGVFTEQIIDRYWLVRSNGRRNDGAFFECFHKNRDQWRGRSIDARTVEGLAQDAYEAIIKEHGPDSDEARVEVYGMFPNQAINQFIPHSLVEEAIARVTQLDPGAPLLMGVDVARGDRDSNVFAFRHGRDARSIPWVKFKSTDTTKVAAQVADYAGKYKVDAIFVDGNGVGGGVVDMLKSWKYRVVEVQAGGSANEDNKYKNKRAEMWALMKQWLAIGCIPGADILKKDLTSPEYSYDPITNQLVLESKEHMRDKRHLASPDEGDALAMTFAQPIARNDSRTSRGHSRVPRMAVGMDSDLLT